MYNDGHLIRNIQDLEVKYLSLESKIVDMAANFSRTQAEANTELNRLRLIVAAVIENLKNEGVLDLEKFDTLVDHIDMLDGDLDGQLENGIYYGKVQKNILEEINQNKQKLEEKLNNADPLVKKLIFNQKALVQPKKKLNFDD